MSRRDRRAFQRQARRDLAAIGCTCTPSVTSVSMERCRALGAADGVLVQHERGCSFGDRIAVWNAVGIVPPLWTGSSSGRCGR